MVTRYGMDATIGQRTYLTAPQPFLQVAQVDRTNSAEATAREIDVAVRDIVAHAFDRATVILRTRG